MPAVSVVIVAWNGRDLLRECLANVARTKLAQGLEALVVDNASSDGAREMVETEFPDVRLLRTGENLGFAGGNNRGFAETSGDKVLLLNPDAFVSDPDLISELADFLDRNPDHGGVGCKLTYPDGRHQVGDAGFAPAPSTVFSHAFGLARVFGTKGLFLPPQKDLAPIEVDWISGALFMVRRDVLERVGGLDESFFMYAEDVEFGCRIRSAGWKIAYLPSRSAVHVQGGTQDTGKSPSTRWLDALAVLYRRYNPGSFAWFRLSMGAGFALRALAYRLAGLARPSTQHAAKARAMATFARHMFRMPRPDPTPPR